MRIQLAVISALALTGLAACGTSHKDTTIVTPAGESSTVVVAPDENKTTTVITPGDPSSGTAGSTVIVPPADK